MAREHHQLLNALDAAKTQWCHHFTAIVIAGMGFFSNAYNLFCIFTVTKLLGRIYYRNDGSVTPGMLPPNVAAAVNGVAFCGTLSGQLFFGWLGDRMDRNKVYGLTAMLMLVCSIGSGLSFGHTAKGVMATLCFFRFWLGFGVGGDYPVSRGASVAAVLSMKGLGILTIGIIAIIISTFFKDRFKAPPYAIDPVGSTVPEADYVWRIILIVGALPVVLTYYCQMKILDTASNNAPFKQAAADMPKVQQVEIEVKQPTKNPAGNFDLFSKEFVRCHGLHVLTWFLLDIAFYGQNLFQKDIFSAINWIPRAATMNAIEEVFEIARAQTLIPLCGTVGYWFTVALIGVFGRFKIQLGGFFMMTVFMLGLAIPYHHWTTDGNQMGFIVMYGLTFFFANFGPNSTTFIMPAEIFSARLRPTFHGISGAIIAAFGFLYKNTGMGVRNLLFVQVGFYLLGFILTLVTELNGK